MARARGEMSGEELADALANLDLTARDAADLLGLSPRQVYRMTAGDSPVPELVAKVIRLMLRKRIKPSDLA